MKIDTADISFYITHLLLPFQNLMPTLPTMQPSPYVTSLEAIYQVACSFVLTHKRLYTTFSTYTVIQRPVNYVNV